MFDGAHLYTTMQGGDHGVLMYPPPVQSGAYAILADSNFTHIRTAFETET